MKLESLKLEKFKENELKKEQMFFLNGGGSATGGGRVEGTHGGRAAIYSYGYDAIRLNGAGGTYLTFHNRSNINYLAQQQRQGAVVISEAPEHD
ncbi:natural product precursor [Aquimarina sp. MAR_2010_214]|uniref:TIGR04149 family rSAM-modified RiPP n=1 Tax=Aquimarina sp. MAR_2010_214 TaxID=1250026 RepID=UPI000C702C0C|nr:TIGR04149 family rSAM-modified RiPP [Aquimarina sp. MAR_2010_214]PKV48682.1 natural product precursor [Aquimarina sp. MAR_2010_214]